MVNTPPQVVMMECTKEYRKIVDYTRMGKMPDFESQENVSLTLRSISVVYKSTCICLGAYLHSSDFS